MSKPPAFKLYWDELLSPKNSSPVPELEVVPAAPESLSDQDLHDRILRIRSHISSGLAARLTDKGDKLRQSLRQLEIENDRRKLARFKKEEDEANKCRSREVSLLRNVPGSNFTIPEPCQSSASRSPTVSLIRNVPTLNYTTSEPCQSPTSRSPAISLLRDVHSPNYTKSEPRQSPTFASLFAKMLNGKADDVAEEPRFVGREKWGSLQGNREQKNEGSHSKRVPWQPLRTLPEQSPYQFASSIASRVTYRSSYGDRRSLESSKISSCHVGRSSLDSSPMKRKASERWGSLHPRSKKVQHVVILDEEEVQPTQPIHNDTYSEGKEVKIYYPSRDDPESVELSYPDIKCLEPEKYLSSPIMNFYIRYLQRPVSPADKTSGGHHFFNTYFYKKLDQAMSGKGDRSAHFMKLRRWWKGVNIFQKAYIFLPVHHELHWSLVIICIPTKEEDSGPVVLHLDSLGIHKSERILGVVGSCLKQEWNCISQHDPPDVPISEKIWKDLPRWIIKKTVRVPQQENVYDCGLFVLYFMERFIKEAPNKFKKKYISSMFGESWFKPEDASGLRKQIKDLVAEEFESARLENGRPESSTSLSGSPENDTDQCDEP